MLIRLQRPIPQRKLDAEALRLAGVRPAADTVSGARAGTGGPSEQAGTGRFQPGALRPIAEKRAERVREHHRSSLRTTFDRALLVAEVACAVVVAWLVLQYIYTAYIDTGPHRVATQRPVTSRPAAGVAASSATPRIVSPTPVGGHDTEALPLVGATPAPGQTGAPEVALATMTPSATAEPTTDPALLLPARLRIPVMFLDSVVREVRVNMGTWEVAPMDIGHHEGTANPGETGNMVLAGHRDINSALFRELDRLKPGDEVYVSNSLREFKYIVTDSFVVTPKHTEVMDPTDDKRVTLITCTPVGLATQRLIVTAILDETAGIR